MDKKLQKIVQQVIFNFLKHTEMQHDNIIHGPYVSIMMKFVFSCKLIKAGLVLDDNLTQNSGVFH